MGLSKRLCACVLMLFFSVFFIYHASAQRKSSEYIEKDSAYVQGRVTYLGSDSVKFQETRKSVPIIYTAREIKEFHADGKTYESLLTAKGVKFYRRLVAAETALYKDKRNYLLKSQNRIVQLNAKNFRSVLQEHLDINGKDKSLSKVSYTEVALRNFVEGCTKGNCNTDHFPYRKFGVFPAYNLLSFNAVTHMPLSLQGNARSVSVGVFGDFPLYLPPSLFVTAELHFISTKASLYNESQGTTNYLGLDASGLMAPLGVKWIFNQGRINSYMKGGALVTYMNINAPSVLIETISTGSDINISKHDIAHKNGFFYGIHAGVGAEIPYRYRKNFHVELKYLKTANSKFDQFKMNFSGVSILAGFNI